MQLRKMRLDLESWIKAVDVCFDLDLVIIFYSVSAKARVRLAKKCLPSALKL